MPKAPSKKAKEKKTTNYLMILIDKEIFNPEFSF